MARTICPRTFESWVAGGKYKVQYKTGEIIKAPETTKLFVFDRLPKRRQLEEVVSLSSGRYALFEVATDELVPAYECTQIFLAEENIAAFWGRRKGVYKIPTITNTAFCNSVVLLKEIAFPKE